MKRSIVGAAIVLAMGAPTSANSRTLNAGIQGTVQARLSLRDGEQMVAYRATGSNTERLVLTRGTGTSTTPVWQTSLPGAPVSLSDSQAPNTVLILGPRGRTKSYAAAFSISASHVSSGISGVPGGIVIGDRGAAARDGGFVVLRTDTSRNGSIPYRRRIRYVWSAGSYRQSAVTVVPDLPESSYPVPRAIFHASSGSTALLKLWVASTPASQEKGLMYKRHMNPDRGMVFVWTQDVRESFWMENTYIPLTVAWLSSTGTVQEMQDMAPLSVDYHTPAQPYRYAIEANEGYFASFGIKVGDRVKLDLSTE